MSDDTTYTPPPPAAIVHYVRRGVHVQTAVEGMEPDELADVVIGLAMRLSQDERLQLANRIVDPATPEQLSRRALAMQFPAGKARLRTTLEPRKKA